MLFIDIDNFKLINDTIGHQAADQVLRSLAESLSALIRTDDLLGLYTGEKFDATATITVEPIGDSVLSRLGGDEFIVLLPDTRDRFAAGTVARRILKHLETADPRRRPRGVRDREHRHRDVSRGRPVERDPDSQRRHRDVPREAARQGGVPVLLGRDERGVGRAAHARERVCGTRSRTTGSRCTTSRRSTSERARSSAPRRCCAGSIRSAATSRRRRSSRSPRTRV